MSDFERSAISLLEDLEKGNVPNRIDGSTVNMSVFIELFEADRISAIDCSTFDGKAYRSPRITSWGRQYLNDLKSQQKPFWLRWSGGWERALAIGGFLIAVIGLVVMFM